MYRQLIPRIWFFSVLAFCAAALAVGSACHAQNLTGTINGVVEDSSGAVIPNAHVTLANAATGVIERALVTDSGGRYEAPALLSGSYKITVQAAGFQTAVTQVSLAVDQSIPVNIALKVGSVTSQVSVSTGTTALDVEDPALSTLVEQKEVTELPMNQRNFVQFISLQPGVNGGTGTITRGPLGVAGGNNPMSISVNGQGHTSNGYYLDGADFINHDEDDIVGMFPSLDSLQEVNLLRNNYGAQYGGEGAAVFNLVSRGGSSSFHGDAFYYFQNQLLNANGYFNNLVGNARIPFRYNDYGYTLGGPLFIPRLLPRAKSNTFFFVGGELLRSAQAASSSVANDPTALQRQGIFDSPVCVAYNSAGKCTSTSTTVTNIDPAAQAWLKDVINKTPLPNGPTNAPQELISSFDGIMNEGQIIGRVDHSFGDKFKMFVRFLNDPYNSVGPEGIGGNTNPIPGLATTSAQSGAENTMAHATYVPSATWVLEGGISHLRAYENTQVIGLLNPANAPDFNVKLPYTNLTGKLPTVTIDGTKYNSAGPIKRINPTNQAFINVTHSMGRHTVLFGVNAEKMKSSYTNYNNGNNGGFTFTAPSSVGKAQAVWEQSFADFLIGYTTSFSQSTFGGGEGYSASTLEAYLQDNFKATRNLTLNAGVRYSYYRDPTEWILNSDNFDPALYTAAQAPTMQTTGYMCLTAPCAGGATPNPSYNYLNGIIIPGQNSPFGRKMVSQPNLNFAPRFGFAWSPFSNGRTAVRGGYGIYYMFPSIWSDEPSGNPPSISTINASNVSFDNPGGNVAASTTPPAISGLGVNYKVAYIESFDLDVQRQFGGFLMDVAYVGNLDRHLPGNVDLNQPQPGAYVTDGIAAVDSLSTSNSILLNRIRPYQGYGAFSITMPMFSTSYNALQVQFKEHLGSTLELGGAYTFSKAMGATSVQNIYNPSADYGVQQRDNMFVAQAVYNLPFYRQQNGWVGHLLGGYEVSGILNLSAGGVLTASTSNQDPAGLGLLSSGTAAVARPDRVGDPNSGPRTIQQWFNKSAFAFVPAGLTRPGDESIGTIYGPGSEVVNLSLLRNVRIVEGTTLQFRAETYNTLNHTNWNNPNSSLNSTSFGIISGNGEPRKMQIAAKFTF